MKPKAFVGSSVEGLPVAYAVQQNLMHDAEVTVWDQGVFELSSTTIESLSKALAHTDFGIFVFSPDDVLRMRGDESTSVRDNVLFEFGLFIGKLGRERVFFLVPSTSPPQIPSDLLGITPAKYETGRTDGSMQAATGAACHQMRQQIKRLGSVHPPQSIISPPGESDGAEAEKHDWLSDFVAERYIEAKAKLEASLTDESDNDALETRAWINYCEFKLDEERGVQKLLEFAAHHNTSAIVQRLTAFILRMERETDRAIELLQSVDSSIRDEPSIKVALAECYVSNEEHDKAITILSGAVALSDPDAALALAEIHESQENLDEALLVVHDAYIRNPRHHGLRFKYARLAQELEQHSVALYFLDELASEKQDSTEYWGYLGNSCLALDLYDRSLYAYRRAESLITSDNSADWIISNIGNLFKNKGLANEAISYLERAISIDSKSEYAHDRLAGALKMRDEEVKEYKKKAVEGLRTVKKIEADRRAAADTSDPAA